MLLPGKVVTFSPVLEDGAVHPTVTLSGGEADIEATVKDEEPFYSVEVITSGTMLGRVRFGNGRPTEVGRGAVGVRIVGEHVWVADENGAVRPFDLRGVAVSEVGWQEPVAREGGQDEFE
jgi:hypothetical protein